MPTYPLTMPTTTRFDTVDLVAVNVTPENRSQFTLKSQVQVFSGQAWQLNVRLPRLTQTQANVWWSWLVCLRGAYGTFLAGNLTHCEPAGAVGGTPLVMGADQTGEELFIDGCSASITDWLKAGDFIQLGSGSGATLHMVKEDVDTNGAGEATLSLWPFIRTAPADNSAIVTSDPVGVFSLMEGSVTRQRGRDGKYDISFSAMEVV